MKYFIDTEFHEGFTNPIFGRQRHFIDLISIGIKSEDGRTYYALSNEFDVKAAWNSSQIDEAGDKIYWLRDNVLKPIFSDLFFRDMNWDKAALYTILGEGNASKALDSFFTYSKFKSLVMRYGNTQRQIAEEIERFIYRYSKEKPEFYAYYADYDWVVFCSMFGKMIDLPQGFPMYCKDLKQMLDFKAEKIREQSLKERPYHYTAPLNAYIESFKKDPSYPEQTNEHNALADAKWNYELYKFLESL